MNWYESFRKPGRQHFMLKGGKLNYKTIPKLGTAKQPTEKRRKKCRYDEEQKRERHDRSELVSCSRRIIDKRARSTYLL